METQSRRQTELTLEIQAGTPAAARSCASTRLRLRGGPTMACPCSAEIEVAET
jgi:hypothetical protein